MDAVDAARRSHAPGVEKMTAQGGSDLAIGIRQTATSLVGAQEFRGDETLRRTDRRRANHQDGWRRHPRLHWRAPDIVHPRHDALRRRPGVVVRVRELK